MCHVFFFLKYALRYKELGWHIKCHDYAMGWTVWGSNSRSGEIFLILKMSRPQLGPMGKKEFFHQK
jgi:hypothetical protein